MDVQIQTPWPPSVNRYWRMARGVFYIAKEGKEFREAVRDIVFEKMLERQLAGRLALKAELYPPDRRRRDADNVLKAMLDALQHAELLDDDNQFKELHVVMTDEVVSEGRVDLLVREMDAPPDPRPYPRNPDIPSGPSFRPWFSSLVGANPTTAA